MSLKNIVKNPYFKENLIFNKLCMAQYTHFYHTYVTYRAYKQLSNSFTHTASEGGNDTPIHGEGWRETEPGTPTPDRLSMTSLYSTWPKNCHNTQLNIPVTKSYVLYTILFKAYTTGSLLHREILYDFPITPHYISDTRVCAVVAFLCCTLLVCWFQYWNREV